jgi:hypothetical protein
MPDVTAVPAAMPGLPEQVCYINGQPAYIPFMGGFFDGTLLNVPIYLWIMIVMMFIIIIIVALYLLRWHFMAPVWRFYDAVMKRHDLGIYIGKNGKVRLEDIEYVAAVFQHLGLTLKWLALSPRSLRWGALNTVIIRDVRGIVDDPDLQIAIKQTIIDWNNEPGRKEEDRIIDYESLVKLVRSRKLPDVLQYAAVAEVPLFELDRYLQDIDSGKFAMIVNHVVEKFKEKEDPNAVNPWIKAAIVIAIILAVVMIGAKVILG